MLSLSQSAPGANVLIIVTVLPGSLVLLEQAGHGPAIPYYQALPKLVHQTCILAADPGKHTCSKSGLITK